MKVLIRNRIREQNSLRGFSYKFMDFRQKGSNKKIAIFHLNSGYIISKRQREKSSLFNVFEAGKFWCRKCDTNEPCSYSWCQTRFLGHGMSVSDGIAYHFTLPNCTPQSVSYMHFNLHSHNMLHWGVSIFLTYSLTGLESCEMGQWWNFNFGVLRSKQRWLVPAKSVEHSQCNFSTSNFREVFASKKCKILWWIQRKNIVGSIRKCFSHL